MYPFNELINDLIYSNKNNQKQDILFIPNFNDFNLNSMNVYLRIRDISHMTATAIPTDELFKYYFQNKTIDVDKIVPNYTYFVYSDTDFGSPWFIELTNNADIQSQLQEKIKQEINDGKISILSSYILPTGQTIHLAKTINR